MTMSLRPVSPANARAAIMLAAAAALAATAWFRDPVADETVAATTGLSGLSREYPPQTDGFLSASPFDPQRRAVEGIGSLSGPVLPEVTAPVPERPAAVPNLAGILVEGGAYKAMFAGTSEWHGVGSRVAGWTVSAIEPERVVLRQGRKSLMLRRDDALRR
jgi:hypothetical protein